MRLLGASACSRFVRPGAVLASCFAFRSRVAASVLECFPDAAHSSLAIGEAFDCSCTRKAIPDADQASRRPQFRQLAKLVETAEVIACVWLAVTGCMFDVIGRINGEGRHRDVLLARF